MRTLVTGGAGFIGAALVERLLAEGHTVDVVDNLSSGSLWNLADARASAGRDLTFHQLDVRSPDVAELVVRRGPEVVWHLAATPPVGTGVATASADAHLNIVGTLALLEGARTAGVRKLVVASSGAVYGELRDGPAATEWRTRRPLSLYGLAKHTVDAYLAAFAELEAVVFTSLVLATVYGPRATAGVVAEWARCLVAGQPCTAFGNVERARDFVFVDDVVDALARAAERADGMILNIGTGHGTTLVALHAEMVAAAGRLATELGSTTAAPPGHAPTSIPETNTGVVRGAAPDALSAVAVPAIAAEGVSEVPILERGPALGLRHAPARPGEPDEVVLDPSRAAAALGWVPWTPLGEGIEAVLRATLVPRR